MVRYIAKRLLLIAPMLIGISLITFIVMHLAPGDPTSMRYGLNPEVSGSARAELKKLYDLDKPVHIQYLLWAKRLARFDFGNSFLDDRPVMQKIVERLPATLLLNVCALAVILLIALPIGVSSAVRHGSLYDKVMTIIVFIGYATPTFWFALILMVVFGFMLGWFPISGLRPWYIEYYSSGRQVADLLWHLVLPVVAASFGGLAGISRYTKSSMLEVLRQDYIRTARAKGLPERKVIYKHALRNGLLPIVTILGFALPGLISGSFIFETIFAWPGMGRLGYEAIMQYDYPVVMGVGVIASMMTLIGILISDILYAFIDPRIRYK
ncbi:MAG: ABC transporter permease [Candidatus Omnitrophica bacterium]|nr:ABC transporter permease [Candidatus Omnitrophota bacterium]